MEREKMHDVIVNMDIILSVPSKTVEDAYDKVEGFSTERLLSVALEQLPFSEIKGGMNFVDGVFDSKHTIN
jgi:hypothetical protein